MTIKPRQHTGKTANLDAVSEQQRVREFESLLDEVRKQLLDAQIHLDIWEQLWPTEENVDVINAYKGFFLPTRNAHHDRFFIKVSNTFSNDPKAPSFYRLLNVVASAPNLTPSINTRSLRTRLKKQKDLLRRIQRYRDKRAAHWDTQVSEPMAPVRLGESRKLLKELQDIFNGISKAHTGNQVWAFKLVQHDDTFRILSSLKQTRPGPSR